MMEDLEEANIEKDNLMQKCHNLEKQVNLLQDEKSNVITEYEILQKEVRRLFFVLINQPPINNQTMKDHFQANVFFSEMKHSKNFDGRLPSRFKTFKLSKQHSCNF